MDALHTRPAADFDGRSAQLPILIDALHTRPSRRPLECPQSPTTALLGVPSRALSGTAYAAAELDRRAGLLPPGASESEVAALGAAAHAPAGAFALPGARRAPAAAATAEMPTERTLLESERYWPMLPGGGPGMMGGGAAMGAAAMGGAMGNAPAGAGGTPPAGFSDELMYDAVAEAPSAAMRMPRPNCRRHQRSMAAPSLPVAQGWLPASGGSSAQSSSRSYMRTGGARATSFCAVRNGARQSPRSLSHSPRA